MCTQLSTPCPTPLLPPRYLCPLLVKLKGVEVAIWRHRPGNGVREGPTASSTLHHHTARPEA